MIQPWQVWQAELDDYPNQRPCLVVSSEFHLRAVTGRTAIIVPVTNSYRPISSRIAVLDADGAQNWIVTEQIRTVSTSGFVGGKPLWTLDPHEIADVRRALRFMVDL